MSANESDPREWGNALIDSVHDYQSEQGITDATMVLSAIEALRTSTLELVEQQRIANLIAYVVKLSSHPTDISDMHPTDIGDFRWMTDQIREGLGIK